MQINVKSNLDNCSNNQHCFLGTMRNKENVTLFVQRSTPRTAKKFLKGKFPHSMLKSGKTLALIDWVHLKAPGDRISEPFGKLMPLD